MGTLAKIVCKGVGVAGMSAVLYDAFTVAKKNSTRVSMMSDADHFERVHADTRTLTSESYVNNAIQKKVADFRNNNSLISIAGNIKGFVSGFFNSLGDNIVPTALASLALAAKGVFAKIGAWGLAGYGLYVVAKEGFGLSKKSPMD